MTQLPHVYLASKSPRRHKLLQDCHIPFDGLDVEIDETDYPRDLPLSQIAEFLAVQKANAAGAYAKDGVVLAADSIVLCNGELLGKPSDKEDAFWMLSLLSGQRHEVVTGVCLLGPERHVVFSESSYVTFAKLSESEIRFYIDRYTPFDKAGAYAIQEWIGHCGIVRIEGSYTNIMGLPTERVYRELKNW